MASFVNPIKDKSRLLATLKKKSFENSVGKENAGDNHFLLFPPCFLPVQKLSCNVYNEVSLKHEAYMVEYPGMLQLTVSYKVLW